MPGIKTILQNKLKGARRIAILGVGSELRGDDAAGMFLVKELQAHIKKKKIKSLKVFLGETAPENLTGEIKKFNPTHLLIIDAMEFGGKPGASIVIEDCKEASASFSTHKMPIGILAEYLHKSIACKTILIGVQPKSLKFSSGLSPKVMESLKNTLKSLKDVLNLFCC